MNMPFFFARDLPLAVFAVLFLAAGACAQTVFLHVDQIDQDLPDANPGDGVCATVNGTCTLRAAIMEANAQAATASLYIVKLPEDADVVLSIAGDDDMAALGHLDIRKNISVTARPLFQPIPVPLPQDQRAKIRNGYLGHHLFVIHPDQTLYLSDLVLSQSTGAVGSANATETTTVVLDHVTITQNHGTHALAVNASHVTIDDSEIIDNVANITNLYVQCPLVIAHQQLQMRRSRVTNNHAGGGASGFGAFWTSVCAGHGPSLIEDTLIADNTTDDPDDPQSGVGAYVLEMRRSTVAGYRHAALVSRWGGNLGGNDNVAGDYTLENVTFTGQGYAGVDFKAGSAFYALRIRNSTLHDQPTDVIIAPEPDFTGSVFQVTGSILTTCSLPAEITMQTDYYNISTSVTGCLVGGSNRVVSPAGLLEPLADNGGHVLTHALPSNSEALDSGPPGMGGSYGCLSVDARGYPRPRDGTGDGTQRCDIGAFEYQGDTIFHDRFQVLP